jgi:hypothetical protein
VLIVLLQVERCAAGPVGVNEKAQPHPRGEYGQQCQPTPTFPRSLNISVSVRCEAPSGAVG